MIKVMFKKAAVRYIGDSMNELGLGDLKYETSRKDAIYF